MAKANVTPRTVERLRQRGYTAGNVERFYGGVKHDLFHCIDIVAMCGTDTLGVQCTTKENMKKRLDKIIAEPLMKEWLAEGSGRRLEVWGWAKRGPRGKRKLWEVTITEITLEMLH